jgi:hypothetical protein
LTREEKVVKEVEGIDVKMIAVKLLSENGNIE